MVTSHRDTVTTFFDLSDINAVLFDFDGVLMQSIEDHHRSWNEVFKTYGVEIGWEEFSVLEGQSLYTIAGQLCRHHGIDESEAEKIGRMKNQVYLSTAKPKFYDGVFPVLEYLHADGKCLALVTGAHRDRFDRSVDERFLSYFDAVITADEVQHTKPHPEPFLKAAAELGIENERCVVIENAPLGVTSAKRAGMRCIALTTTLGEEHLAEADLIVGSLADLKRVFTGNI